MKGTRFECIETNARCETFFLRWGLRGYDRGRRYEDCRSKRGGGGGSTRRLPLSWITARAAPREPRRNGFASTAKAIRAVPRRCPH